MVVRVLESRDLAVEGSCGQCAVLCGRGGRYGERGATRCIAFSDMSREGGGRYRPRPRRFDVVASGRVWSRA